MDFGETMQKVDRGSSTIAGTERYMSFKLAKAYKDSKSQYCERAPIVEHDFERSELMSLARTIISLCLLRECDVLNDENTYKEEQKRVFRELRENYSDQLISLLQGMMTYPECQYHSYDLQSKLRDLLKQHGFKKLTDLQVNH